MMIFLKVKLNKKLNHSINNLNHLLKFNKIQKINQNTKLYLNIINNQYKSNKKIIYILMIFNLIPHNMVIKLLLINKVKIIQNLLTNNKKNKMIIKWNNIFNHKIQLQESNHKQNQFNQVIPKAEINIKRINKLTIMLIKIYKQ